MSLFRLIILLTVAVSPNFGWGQTYYNPSNHIDITISIKEPFKPINYNDIGYGLNRSLQDEIARRDAKKKYYEDIYYDTKTSVISNSYLTSDDLLNSKLFLLQNITNERIDYLYRLLRQGLINEGYYVNSVKSTYFKYVHGNQAFLNLCRYNYFKLSDLVGESTQELYKSEFQTQIRSITNFVFNDDRLDFQYNYVNVGDVNNLFAYISGNIAKKLNSDNTNSSASNKVNNTKSPVDNKGELVSITKIQIEDDTLNLGKIILGSDCKRNVIVKNIGNVCVKFDKIKSEGLNVTGYASFYYFYPDDYEHFSVNVNTHKIGLINETIHLHFDKGYSEKMIVVGEVVTKY